MSPNDWNAIEMVIRFLEESVGGYATVLILLAVYLLIQIGMKAVLKNETNKRKALMEELDEIKDKYLTEELSMANSSTVKGIDHKFDNLQTTMVGVGITEKTPSFKKIQVVREAIKDVFLKNNYLKTIHAQGNLSEEALDRLIEESKQAKKKSAVRPILHIFSFLFPIIVFATLLLNLYVITSVPFHIALPISTAIVTFFTNVTSKRVWIFAALSIMLFLIYKELSGATNLFILLYFVYRYLDKQITKRQKREKQ